MYGPQVKALINEGDLATDVPGAEALIDRHGEHRLEIDARNATFRAFELSGKNLISTNHYLSDDVEAYLDMMGEKREDLEKTWIARRMELDQCLELQLFYREVQPDATTETNHYFICCLISNINSSIPV